MEELEFKDLMRHSIILAQPGHAPAVEREQQSSLTIKPNNMININ